MYISAVLAVMIRISSSEEQHENCNSRPTVYKSIIEDVLCRSISRSE